MTTVIMRTVTRIVVPLTMLVSIALFLQGHNHPGGGFIAGVLTASGFALIYIAYSLDFLEERILRRTGTTTIEHIQHGVVANYRQLYAIGLAIGVGSGIAAIAYGFLVADTPVPFMSQGYTFVHLPLYGSLEIASATVFDFGVYAVVVGSLLTILSVVGSE